MMFPGKAKAVEQDVEGDLQRNRGNGFTGLRFECTFAVR